MKNSKKHKFTEAEKYAVYRILGPNCIWCREPVEYRDAEIDHVLPESLDTHEADQYKDHYKLHDNFALNSFFNWAPVHPRCNKSKLAKTFNGAPFIGGILHKINKRVVEITKLHEKAKLALDSNLTLLQIEQAIDKKQLTKQDVDNLFDQKLNYSKIKPSTIYDLINCTTSPITYKGSYGNKSPIQFYDISFEQFNTSELSLVELNTIIKSDGLNELINARENYYGYLKDYDQDETFPDLDSIREYDMGFSLVTKQFISYTSTSRFYQTGAAHGQYAISGHNYYIDVLRPLYLPSILLDYVSFVRTITPLAYGKIIQELKERTGGNDEELDLEDSVDKWWLNSEYTPFENYHFSQNCITFIFNPYEITPWALGAQLAEFSFDELTDLFPEEIHLVNLINEIRNGTELKKNRI